MKIQSTNLATPTNIQWKGKTQTTGIYKRPVPGPVRLQLETVNGDTIGDPKVHGGPDKACYLFSAEHYPYWKEMYPLLDWHWGMFGENLTLEGMDEAIMRIGDVYQMGSAVVQVSMPREPCYKLGLRFGSQKILKEFIAYGYPGTYIRILQEGEVMPGDEVKLVKASNNPLTVRQCFQLLFARDKAADLLQAAISNEALPERKRLFFTKHL